MVQKRLKILSISAVYPTDGEPNLGIFVKRRLDHMAELADIRVLAPAPAIDYAKLRAARGGGSKTAARAGTLPPLPYEVQRPKWFFPPGGGVLNPPLLAAQLAPAVRRLQRGGSGGFAFDVIDAHFAYPTGVAAALLSARFGRPFAITLRGDETMHAGTSALRARWIDWALRRASAILAVSGRLRDWAISRGGVAPDRAFTIPNGVDTSTFRLLPDADLEQARLALRTRTGATANQDRVVLSAGYLIERKGHHHLIRAVHQMQARHGAGRVHIAIAGEPGREGNFAETLRSLTESLGMSGQVHFLGRQSQSDLSRLMNGADLLVLPSSREGWPNVVQEALASGCPVVASDIGGTPDMIPDDRYGYLLPEGDVQPASLADALERALARSANGSWDRRTIAEWGGRRSWNHVARDVVECLEGALGSGARSGEARQRQRGMQSEAGWTGGR